MDQKVIFSVIVPAYNSGKLLPNLFDSLRNQTLQDFEVIICDDGSTDDTQSVVKTFEATLNIKYIKLKNHGGPAGPRNAGINIASGKYCAFLDSDDEWYNNKLSYVLETLNKGYDWIYHDLNIVRDGIKVGVVEARDYNKENAVVSLLTNFNPIPTSGMVVKTSLLRQVGLFKVESEYHFVEDYDYWLRLVKINTNSFAIKTSLGIYNDHVINNSKRIDQIEKLGNLYDLYNKDIKSSEVEMSKKYAQFSLSFNAGNKSLCYELSKDMIRIKPFSFLTLKALMKYFKLK